jgi:hypothetical protein
VWNYGTVTSGAKLPSPYDKNAKSPNRIVTTTGTRRKRADQLKDLRLVSRSRLVYKKGASTRVDQCEFMDTQRCWGLENSR